MASRSMNSLSTNSSPTVCLTGDGGFIVVWWDERNIFADIYAQRINENGEALWNDGNAQFPTGGMPVCTGAGVQRLPQIVPTEEAGETIVYWLDYREDFGDSTEDAIYAATA